MLLKSVTSLFVICGVFAITAATSVSTDAEECPKACSRNYEPLCATNGKVYKEFSNACELKTTNCRLERSAEQDYIPTAMDWCTTELVDSMQQLLEKFGISDLNTVDCLKACPFIYSPVCISNGQYRTVISNECILEGINCVLGNKTAAVFSVLQYNSC